MAKFVLNIKHSLTTTAYVCYLYGKRCCPVIKLLFQAYQTSHVIELDEPETEVVSYI